MIYSYSLFGGQQLKRSIPLFGNATDIKAGAVVMNGGTDGTNNGYGVIGASTLNKYIGVTEALFQASVKDNDPTTGLKYILTDVTINPDAVYQTEYEQSSQLSIASVVAATSFTVTSGENLGGGWILGVGAPGLGYLAYVSSTSTGTYTPKTLTFPFTTASKVIKIMPLYSPKVNLTTDTTKIIGSNAAQGSWLIRVLENYVKAPGFDLQALDPTKHDGITFASGVKMFAMLTFETSIYNSAN